MSDFAINLIPLRPGVDVAEFASYSAELDQPLLMELDVVESFEVYAVEHATDGARSMNPATLSRCDAETSGPSSVSSDCGSPM